MTLKGKIYSLAKQREDIDSRNVFESMIKRSAGENGIVLDGRNLAAGSIFADQIHANAITAEKIKADAVTTDKITAGAITAGHIAANSVTAEKIKADAVTADKIVARAIETDHIKSGAIETDHMNAGTIDVSVLKGNQLILPGKNYGGVVIDNEGISMKSTGTAKLDVKLSSGSGFNITDGSNNQLIDINPSTGNVKMQVNQMTIGGHSAATTKDIDDIEVGGRNLIIRHNEYSNSYLDQEGKRVTTSGHATMRDYIKVTPGEKLAFTQPAGYFYRYNWYDQKMNYISRRADSNAQFVWTVPSNAHFIWVSYTSRGEVKIEKGNKATDWTPAPEDVQAEIDSRPTFQDFDQTDKVTINGGNIKAGTISSKNNYSRINLDDGSFNFGDGRLVWNGSEMTVNGKISVSNIDGDIPKDKLEGSLQTEIDAGSAAKSTLDSKESDWDTGSSRAADALNRTTIHDRRNDNRPPSWYLSNYPRQVVQEFKSVSTMGVGQGVETYGILTTIIQYADSTGGRIKQEFKVGKNVYTRSGAGESWDSWTDPIGRTEAWSYNGTTEIDGKSIKTGTLEANKITTGTMHGDRITSNTLNANRITSGTITGDKISAGTITADKIVMGTGTPSSGNLAAGRTFSGNYSGTVPGDGNNTVGGSYASFGSGGSNNNQAESSYVQVDLGSAQQITESRIFFYAQDRRRYYYKIKYSTNGSTWFYAVGNSANNGWTISRHPSSGSSGSYEPTIDRFAVPITARYIRIYGNGNTVNTSNHIYEWELYSKVQTTISGSEIVTGTLSANKITTGTLSSQNNNSWLNLNNGEFNFANNGLVYSGGNLTLNGKLNVSNLDGKISDSQITSATTWNTVTSKQDADSRLDNMVSAHNLPYTKDIIVYGDSDKYYPVYVRGGNQDLFRTIKIWRSYSERGPNDWHTGSNSTTHKGSLMLTWKGNFGGWGGATYKEFIEENTSSYSILLADCFRSVHSMAYTFMLKGGGSGGAIYHMASDQNLNQVEIYYNGSSDIVYPNSNANHIVRAETPITTVNTKRLEELKLAKSKEVIEVDDKASDAKNKTDAWSYNDTTMIDGTSIETGTLSANKITTGTMHGDRITAGTLSANRITGRIPGENITLDGNVTVNGTFKVSNTNINSGLEANKITTGTMHGDRITANTLSANRINTSSLSAISANLGSITAGKISGSNMTLDLSNGQYKSTSAPPSSNSSYNTIELYRGKLESTSVAPSGTTDIGSFNAGDLSIFRSGSSGSSTVARTYMLVQNGNDLTQIGAGYVSAKNSMSVGGASVVASGESNGGWWVRFYDGTQICYGVNVKLTYHNSTALKKSVVLPIDFFSASYAPIPTLRYSDSVPAEGAQYSRGELFHENRVKGGFDILWRVSAGDSRTTGTNWTVYTDWIAIGRWKK